MLKENSHFAIEKCNQNLITLGFDYVFLLTAKCEFSHVCSTSKVEVYQRFPGEDVGIETDPVLGEVEPPVDENVPLQST